MPRVIEALSIKWSICWFLMGALAAWIFTTSIKWSSRFLRPEKRIIANVVIFVGYFLRWFLVAGLLFIAVQDNIIYAIVCLLGFLMARNIFLLRIAKSIVGNYKP